MRSSKRKGSERKPTIADLDPKQLHLFLCSLLHSLHFQKKKKVSEYHPRMFLVSVLQQISEFEKT